jgi:hypothetical protein
MTAAPEPAKACPEQPGTLAPPQALAIPDKGRRLLVPARHGVLPPLDELLGGPRMLAGQGAAVEDALAGDQACRSLPQIWHSCSPFYAAKAPGLTTDAPPFRQR